MAIGKRASGVWVAVVLVLLVSACSSSDTPQSVAAVVPPTTGVAEFGDDIGDSAAHTTTGSTPSLGAATAATTPTAQSQVSTTTAGDPAVSLAITAISGGPASTATVGAPEVDTATSPAPDAGTSTEAPRRTNDELVLQPVTEITGRLSPKSIVASGAGLYFAQNMMYQHTISVFDADKQLVATLEDSVDLRAFGYDVAGENYQGAPVEAAFTSDGSHVFVSNYRMYGPGYDPNAGGDSCGKDRGQQSFVYRIDTTSLEIDRVYEVGPVPKSVAVTPDDRLLLVSNWCGFDVSVIDLKTDETLAEIEVGRYPRGIAVTSEGSTAYVAVMGSTDIAVIDLSAVSSGGTQNGAVDEFGGLSYLQGVGAAPRHLILSPDDDVLYVSLNGEDAVVALDAATGLELMRVRTGTKPRSMDISDDGTALYVVNYESNTLTKLRTRDFAELESFGTANHPIGITYDSFNDEVWVSAYSGVIHVFAERAPEAPPCTTDDCQAGTDIEEAAAFAPEPGAAEPESEPEGVGLEESASPESATTSASTVIPTVEAFSDGSSSFEHSLRIAEQLAPHILVPGDCAPSPLNNPERLPNAARSYRGGTHQGVDFPCSRGIRSQQPSTAMWWWPSATMRTRPPRGSMRYWR